MGKVLCFLGIHKRVIYELHEDMHMGLFGGPVYWYEWECRRCGTVGHS